MTKNQMPSRGPDYGMAKILRGFSGFEDIYQGLSRGIPIALSTYQSKTGGREPNAAANYAAISGGLAKQTIPGDPVESAAVDGVHSPNLVDGIPTVLGSNCVFLLPRSGFALPDLMPMYKLIWRVRALDTFTQTQLPYHANLRGFRYQDTQVSTEPGFAGDPVLAGLAAQRGVMATVSETIRITNPRATERPLSNLGYQASLDLGVQAEEEYGEQASFFEGEVGQSRFIQGPILPFVGVNAEVNSTTGNPYVYADLGQSPLTAAAGKGIIAADSLSLRARAQVSHVSYSTVAKGDEVIVLVYNAVSGGSLAAPGTYNFDAEDLDISCMFGRGGYENPFGSEVNPQTPLFPNGAPFGVYLIQGNSG